MIGLVRESIEAHPERVRLRARAASDAPWFDGHFPGAPILPAVALLHMAQEEIAGAWPELVAPSCISALRLRRPVGPEQDFELELERAAGSHAVLVRFSAERVELARARFEYSAEGGA